MGELIRLQMCTQCKHTNNTRLAGDRYLCAECILDYEQLSEQTGYHPDDLLIQTNYSIPRSERIMNCLVRNTAKKMEKELPNNWGRK